MPANTVEIRLRLKDQISAAYKRVKNAVGSSNKQIQASMGRVTRANKQVEASFNRTARAADRAKSSSMGLRAVYAGLAAFITGRLVRAVGKAGSEVEDLTVQFKVLMGSTKLATDMMKRLEKFAQTTPFQLADLGQGVRTMLAYGVEVGKLEMHLKQLGDVSLGSRERFERLTLAFAQIHSVGRLTGRDLLQLTQAGFNPLKEIAKVTGETIEQLTKRMEQGKVPVEEIDEAFRSATAAGGQFYKGMKEMSSTVTGLTSTLKDQLAAVIRQMLAGGLWDALKEKMVAVREVFNDMLDSGTFKRWGENLMSIGPYLKTVIRIGGIFFGVFTVSKIMAIAVAFSILLKKFILANPLITTLVGTLSALEILFAKMDARTRQKAKSIIDFAKDIESTDKLIYALETLQSRQDALASARDKSAMSDKLEESYREVEALTNSFVRKRLEAGKLSVQQAIEIARAQKKILEQPAAAPGETPKMPGAVTPTPMGVPDEKALKQIEQQAQRAYDITQELNIMAFENVGQMRNTELVKEMEWYNQRREQLEMFNESTAQLDAGHLERREAIIEKYRSMEDKKARQYAQKEIEITQRKEDLKIQMARNGIEAAQALFGESKAAFLLLKGLAAAEIFINTQRAAMAALAPPPLGLGPVLGGPLAATMQAAGGVAIAGVAAQAIAGFKDGGIVKGDQIVRVGEGGTSEAIIPLKNGAVPVRIEGQGQGSVVHNHYYMGGDSESSGYGETAQERYKRFAETRRETDRLQVTG